MYPLPKHACFIYMHTMNNALSKESLLYYAKVDQEHLIVGAYG